MTTEFISMRNTLTVSQALEKVKEIGPQNGRNQYPLYYQREETARWNRFTAGTACCPKL